MIRITGGKYLGKKINTPSTSLTKPTMDRVREGVFNALQGDIYDAAILDLFAGSGSYGFESLSRGARKTIFVDNNLDAVKCLNSNISLLKVFDNASIHQMDSMQYLRNTNEKFDIVFVDPPYKAYSYKLITEVIIDNDILSEKGIIVLESEDNLEIDERLFKKVKQYKYGLAKIYILRK